MGSFKDVFSQLQLAILTALPAEKSTFLSGAGALSGHYLGHRTSRDLDFFCTTIEAVQVIAASVTSLGALNGWSVTRKQDTPAFLRFQVASKTETTLIDVVHEPVPQIVPVDEKPIVDGVRVDSLEDLIANKLGALSRLEVKDLVDLYFLKQAGHDALAHIDDANKKDGGIDAATLAHILHQMPVDPSRLTMIKAVSTSQLGEFRDELIDRLLAMARAAAART